MQTHRAKKALGQHFLTSKKIVSEIAHVAELTQGDTVLEVGPGKGVLTRALLETGAHVVAIEKDRDLVEILSHTFTREIESKQLTLVQGDVLTFEPAAYGLKEHAYKLVANIPYYITGEIMRRFLSGSSQPERMVLLVQKEVAERVVARDKKESILSMSVKLYGEARIALRVSKKFFSPAPKVDSAVLVVENIRRALPSSDEKRFFTLVKKGFSQKRKQLQGTLSDMVSKNTLTQFFNERGIRETVRAEDLTLEDWLALSQLHA